MSFNRTTTSPRRASWAPVLAAVILAAAVAAIYSRDVDAPFLCDDSISIQENESIRHLWPLWGSVEEPGPLRPAKDLSTAGRPLVNFSFAVNYFFNGLEPRGYHVVNAALLVVNAWLFALLVARTLRLSHFAGRYESAAGPLAFLAGLLWATHPLVTELVMYSTQRTELMVTFFYLTTFYSCLRFWESERGSWAALAIAACWAGMASKEVMVSAPVIALLFDRTFVAGSLSTAWQKSRPLYLGLFSSWALLLILNAGGPRSESAGFHLGLSPVTWWFTQCEVLLMYLRLAVWPWPLAIHYEPPYLESLADAWPYVLPVAVLVVGTLVLLWRNTAAGWVATFAFAVLSPTLLVPILTEIAAERRMYLPLAGLLALVVVGGYTALCRFCASHQALGIVSTAALLLAVVAGVASNRRLAVYNDELTLWGDVASKQPENATANYNVGTFLMNRGQSIEAIAYFERALTIRPDDAQSHHNLGAVLSKLGRHDEATRHFKQAVAAQPNYALGHNKLGFTEMKAGHPEQAQKHFEQAIAWDPKNADANRGLAGALLALGRPADAEWPARTAVQNAAEDAEAHNVLGAVLAQLGNFPEAIAQLEMAVELDPKLLQARGNLMAAYAGTGRRDEAIATAHKALELAEAQGDTDLAAQINAFLASIGAAPTSNAPQSNE